MADADVVIVGCKLPHGLTVEIDKQVITFNGLNSLMHRAGKLIETPLPVGLFAFTTVPKPFWDKFIKIYGDSAYLKAGAVFVQTSEKNAKASAKEREKVKTGFEGLDPDHPEHAVRGIAKGEAV